MPSPNDSRKIGRLRVGLAMALLCGGLTQFPAWGQSTLTVTDLLKQQSTSPNPPAAPKIERAKATVTLNAIYGTEQQLRFDMSLNGQQRYALTEGDLLKVGSASCRVHRYDAQKRCIDLSQVASSFDICPSQACWTGHAQAPLSAHAATSTPGAGARQISPVFTVPAVNPQTLSVPLPVPLQAAQPASTSSTQEGSR